MNAIILSIGDELVLGQTVDTNSAWISQELARVGCAVSAHMTVGDDQKGIEQAIREYAPRCDFLVISGGIGPTEDDLTRQALAAVMGVTLEMNEWWLAKLKEFFEKRGRPMPETNTIQAMIPRGAIMIDNTAGTAAGIRAQVGGVPPLEELQNRPLGKVLTKLGKITQDQVDAALRMQKEQGGPIGEILISLHYITENDRDLALLAQKGDPEFLRNWPIPHRKCEVFVMPGVPKEMKIMFARDVLPVIEKAGGGAAICSRTIHTFGQGESAIAEMLGDLMKRDRNPSVGTTVSGGVVSLRVNSRFGTRERAQQEMERICRECEQKVGDLIYGCDDELLQTVVGKLLAERDETVTTAESCTGGLLAKMLTDVSGSSSYFTQGWVTYSNKAKQERLGISQNLLNMYGAVSERVAEAMATNARRLAKADYALSISGVAGPTGGTPAKPVGMVCISLAHDKGVLNRTFNFPGDREWVRDRSAKMALTMLRYQLLGKPMPF